MVVRVFLVVGLLVGVLHAQASWHVVYEDADHVRLRAGPGGHAVDIPPGRDVVLEGVAADRLFVRNTRERFAVTTERLADATRVALPPLPAGSIWLEDVQGKVVAELAVPLGWGFFSRLPDGRVRSTKGRRFIDVSLSHALARIIRSARYHVDLCMSDFDDARFVDAVIDAHRRGVRVRFVTDTRTVFEEAAAREKLAKGGVRWITDGRPAGSFDERGMMHHKFVVVDDTVVWCGHMKPQGPNERANQCAVTVAHPVVARDFVRELENFWGSSGPLPDLGRRKAGMDKPHRLPRIVTGGGRRIEVWHQPSTRVGGDRLCDRIAHLADQARREILILVSGLGGRHIERALRRARHERDVDVVGVIGIQDWDHSIAFELLGLHPDGWKKPARVVPPGEWYAPGRHAHVHNRIMLVDRTTLAVTSTAWNANKPSDESLLVIEDPDLARAFLAHVSATLARGGLEWAPRSYEADLVDLGGGRRGISLADFDLLFARPAADGTRTVGGHLEHRSLDMQVGPGAPRREGRRLVLDEGARGVDLATLVRLGISVHRREGRVWLESAEGRRVVLREVGDLELMTRGDGSAGGLSVGPYRIGLPAEPSAKPVVSPAGMTELPARVRTRRRTARWGTPELIAAVEAVFDEVEARHPGLLTVNDLASRWGGVPDRNEDGFTDRPTRYLEGEDASFRFSRRLSREETLWMVDVFAEYFSPIILEPKAVAEPEEIAGGFPSETWIDGGAKETYWQRHQNVTITSVALIPRSGGGGAFVRLRKR